MDELLAAGHQVIGIDRQEKGPAFLPYVTRDLTNFRFFRLDLNQDGEKIIALLRSQQPDYIMNLAALSEVAPSWQAPEQWYQTNVVALTKIIDGIKDLPFKMFTQVSTPEVYGSCEGLVKEDYRLNPSTPYAASKAAFDLSLTTFIKNYSLHANFTRAANVYGAHQQLFKIIPRTFIYLKMGKTLPLQGGGTAVRSFTHVRDVARAYIEVMLRGRSAEIYHISTDTMVQIRELVAMICDRLGKKMEDCVEIVPARPGHDAAYTLDSSKIRSELGWQPQIDLAEGLKEVHDWIEQYWAEVAAEPLEYVHQA